MICNNCGGFIDSDEKFCGVCGEDVGSQLIQSAQKHQTNGKKFCGICGTKLLVGNVFCTKCGTSATDAQPMTSRESMALRPTPSGEHAKYGKHSKRTPVKPEMPSHYPSDQSERNKKPIRIWAICLIAVLVLGAVGIGYWVWQGYVSNDDLERRLEIGDNSSFYVERFSVDISDVIVGEETEVAFSAKIISESVLKAVEIQSVEGVSLGHLNYDTYNEDSFYSGVLLLHSDQRGYLEYFLFVDKEKSASVQVFFYHALTDADFEELHITAETMMEIQAKYLDEEGVVSQENVKPVLDEVATYVISLHESGVIESYCLDDDSITIDFASGITNIYTPTQKDVLSSGSNNTIITIEPDHSTLTARYGRFFSEISSRYHHLE